MPARPVTIHVGRYHRQIGTITNANQLPALLRAAATALETSTPDLDDNPSIDAAGLARWRTAYNRHTTSCPLRGLAADASGYDPATCTCPT